MATLTKPKVKKTNIKYKGTTIVKYEMANKTYYLHDSTGKFGKISNTLAAAKKYIDKYKKGKK